MQKRPALLRLLLQLFVDLMDMDHLFLFSPAVELISSEHQLPRSARRVLASFFDFLFSTRLTETSGRDLRLGLVKSRMLVDSKQLEKSIYR
ncbi:hypothetical protein [Variovorax sp. TBS-050B]|uniref:hypothetical protein n=1 Tax=Variovorax sp. TBS-050B TaxID=2940551 RepID=UPI002476D6C0|nr:hypothetical protein [Variovorax sp. TBS-050B]